MKKRWNEEVKGRRGEWGRDEDKSVQVCTDTGSGPFFHFAFLKGFSLSRRYSLSLHQYY